MVERGVNNMGDEASCKCDMQTSNILYQTVILETLVAFAMRAKEGLFIELLNTTLEKMRFLLGEDAMRDVEARVKPIFDSVKK